MIRYRRAEPKGVIGEARNNSNNKKGWKKGNKKIIIKKKVERERGTDEKQFCGSEIWERESEI